MPRNQTTYGKRRKGGNTFVTSTAPWSSSPLKVDQTAALLPEGDVINVLAEKIAKVSIQDVEIAEDVVQEKEEGNTSDVPRKVLRTRDANARKKKDPLRTKALKKEISVDLSKTPQRPVLKSITSPIPTELVSRPKKEIEAEAIEEPSPVYTEISAYVEPLLRLCNDPTGRLAPSPFSEWSENIAQHLNITKIAEASYGEVYRLSLKSSLPGFSTSDESVLKIIALKPPPDSKRKISKTRIDMMSAVDNVLSEVQLMQRMSVIPGFTNFREVRVLQGRPGRPFIDAWKAWNKGRDKDNKSVFPDPSRKASYDEEQLWAVIEMQDAGSDLENVIIDDVWGIWDVFWGVALALGKGEEGARFEHRDLHLGNICVKPTASNTPPDAYTISNTSRKLGYTGLETTIIDYTLSRAEMHPDSSNPSEESVAYLDLELDPALFEGDSTHEYQYDIYRYMRSAIYLLDPMISLSKRMSEALATGRTWRGFHPQTNVIWLHFILYKLLEQITWPTSDPDHALARLADGEDKDKALKRARKLEKRLLELQDLLDLERWAENGIGSVRELVGLALAKGWLGEADIMGVATEDTKSIGAMKIKSAKSIKGRKKTKN